MRVLAEKTQRDTKTLAMLALPGPTTSQARRADRIDDYKWISGPMTTVQDGHIVPKATAVTRVDSAAQQWFSESSGSGTVVLGNQPISVSRIGTSTYVLCCVSSDNGSGLWLSRHLVGRLLGLQSTV